MSNLIDYCKQSGVELVFTNLPSCLGKEHYAQINYAKQWLKEHDAKLLELDACWESMGIDFTTDLADPSHLNVYGAKKVSAYVADYLKQTYGLEDHRGDERYQMYEKAHRLFTLRFDVLDAATNKMYEDYEPDSYMWRDVNFQKFD